MAAVDATTHQEVGIMQIVNLFDDEANFDRLRACRSEQEVLDLIKNAPRRLFKRNTIMSLPMLQVALDNQTLASAYETTRLIAEEVDIIEVGTILCVGEGVRAVRDLKALYPHKIVLADAKNCRCRQDPVADVLRSQRRLGHGDLLRRYQHRQRGAGCRQRVQRRCAN
ncbi:3-keto-L-gulonate 6-phosphate decarboxylase [Klebsiella pneumoniae ISC21]|nr:3-keto-L-gulonate 6-phosphate decarboxylase [Klebsiella pneumoniae ISC21]